MQRQRKTITLHPAALHAYQNLDVVGNGSKYPRLSPAMNARVGQIGRQFSRSPPGNVAGPRSIRGSRPWHSSRAEPPKPPRRVVGPANVGAASSDDSPRQLWHASRQLQGLSHDGDEFDEFHERTENYHDRPLYPVSSEPPRGGPGPGRVGVPTKSDRPRLTVPPRLRVVATHSPQSAAVASCSNSHRPASCRPGAHRGEWWRPSGPPGTPTLRWQPGCPVASAGSTRHGSTLFAARASRLRITGLCRLASCRHRAAPGGPSAASPPPRSTPGLGGREKLCSLHSNSR